MSNACIAIRDLGFRYGEMPALVDIDLAVAPGEIYGLVGPDGAGKSTLLRLATGQLQPQAGSLQVLGLAADDPALRDDIAYMPQGFGLYPDLGVLENLEFFADLHGLSQASARSRIDDLLQRTGLVGFEKRRAANLSGGMMQKLALACALVTEPRVMFLDEPTTGVDPLSRRAFWRLLLGVRSEGVAILYATANMDEAERCDRVGLLQNGRILREGTPEALVQVEGVHLFAVSGEQVRGHREALRRLPGVELVFPVGAQLNIWIEDSATARLERQVAAIDPRLAVEAQEPSLNDVMLRYLTQGARSLSDT